MSCSSRFSGIDAVLRIRNACCCRLVANKNIPKHNILKFKQYTYTNIHVVGHHLTMTVGRYTAARNARPLPKHLLYPSRCPTPCKAHGRARPMALLTMPRCYSPRRDAVRETKIFRILLSGHRLPRSHWHLATRSSANKNGVGLVGRHALKHPGKQSTAIVQFSRLCKAAVPVSCQDYDGSD